MIEQVQSLAQQLGKTASLQSRKVGKLLHSFTKRKSSRSLMLIILAVYVLAQASINFPSFSINSPARDDDAYGYLLKAAQIDAGCFDQDCPALNDLRAQVTKPAEDPDIAGYRNRIYHRLFVVYHPLHSIGITSLHAAGLDYETSYDLIIAIAKVAMPLAVAYFLYTIWGLPATAVSLLLLAPTLFSGSGIHIVKMHVIALAIAFVLWAKIYKEAEKSGGYLLVLSILMSLIHPLGKLLALASLVLYVCLQQWPLKRQHGLVAAASGLVIGLLFIGPNFISAPEFVFDPVAFYPGQWNYLFELGEGLKLVWAEVTDWANAFGGWIALAPVAVLGLWSHVERRKIFFVSAMILAIFISGLVYVVPWYGNISFARIWPAVAIFATAAFCAGLLEICKTALAGVRISPVTKANKKSSWLLILPGAVAVFLLMGAGNYFAMQISRYMETANTSLYSGEFVSRGQVALLDEAGLPQRDSTVLYMDELALHYYLTYGGLNHGAIYYTALRFTPDLDAWLEQREGEIAFVVNRNPMMQIPHNREGMIALTHGDSLRIDLGDRSVDDQALVYFESRSTDVSLKVVYGKAQETKTWTIEAGEAGWFPLPVETFGSNSIVLRFNSSQTTAIGGFRIEEGAQTLWPWDRGIAVTYEDGDERIVVDLLGSSLAYPLNFDIVVLDDRGLFVLGRVQ